MSLKILLVEDHLINQKMAAALLKKLGFSVDLAKNGEEAVVLHKANKYDGILMDIQMPIMDGFEATKIIRESDNETPIIALSGNPDSDFSTRIEELGMNGYLKKPIDVALLTSTLKSSISAYM
ncbi:MAG: response regulator [Campylobacterota bacterium]|nr:response regulator [Campylobacterota bacterium]